MKKLLFVLSLLLVMLSSCEYECQTYNIKLYSESGTIIREWKRVKHFSHDIRGNTYVFTDPDTNKRIIISGNIILE